MKTLALCSLLIVHAAAHAGGGHDDEALPERIVRCAPPRPAAAECAEPPREARVSYEIPSTGKVRSVKLVRSSGCEAFDRSIVRCVKKWTFRREADAKVIAGVTDVGVPSN